VRGLLHFAIANLATEVDQRVEQGMPVMDALMDFVQGAW
jgi:hypothetical protein